MRTCQRDIQTELSQAIAGRIGEARYRLWFARHTVLRWDEECLTVGVPNRHFEEWLQKTFGEAVTESAGEVFGRPMRVHFVIDPALFQAARREQSEAKEQARAEAPLPAPEGKARPEAPVPVAGRRIRQWRRLPDFVIGPCNRVAHAAALSVVEAPNEAANPLVLFGPVGTGKTHLLEGTYGGLRKARPDWQVKYVTSEDFTNRFVQAMRHDKLSAFRKQFRECDVLLLDDLHFLARKKATQEEFLHTFDALLADGRLVVLACDCHPRLADDFAPELADRLLGGAVWGLSPPDLDTRLAILRARGQGLGDEVVRFLAGQLRGNVRELEGAIQGVRHFARVTGRTIDVPLVREALADLLRHAVRVVQVADVERAVCAALRLQADALRGDSRAWAISHPRMVAMFVARKHTAASYSEIGVYFGGRNHSTVVAAEKKVRAWLASDETWSVGDQQVRVRELVERVERDLLR